MASHSRGLASRFLPGSAFQLELLLPGVWHLNSLPLLKALLAQWERICLQCRRPGFDPWVEKIPWGRKWQPTPIFLPGESHGWKRLAGYSPWGCKSWS